MPEPGAEGAPRTETKPQLISEQDALVLDTFLEKPKSLDNKARREEEKIYERKRRYLRQLPAETVQVMFGHVMNEMLEDEHRFQQRNEYLAELGRPTHTRNHLTTAEIINAEISGKPDPNHPKPSSLIQGEIFELLVDIQAKNEGYRTKNKGLTPEQKLLLEEQSQLLLAVAHSPEVFGLTQFRAVRNPDLAWIQVDQAGNLVIKGIAEAKSTDHLDSRAYRQLSKTGFRTTLADIANAINNLEDADLHGLKGFGKNGTLITIDPEVIQYVVVCKGQKPTNHEAMRKFVKPTNYDKHPLTNTEQEDFARILSGQDHTVMLESPFTRDEIISLTKHLLKNVAEQARP